MKFLTSFDVTEQVFLFGHPDGALEKLLAHREGRIFAQDLIEIALQRFRVQAGEAVISKESADHATDEAELEFGVRPELSHVTLVGSDVGLPIVGGH